MRRSKQVYLDSSDFSRFGQVLEGSGTLGNVYRELLTLADGGEVEFRLSYTHVAEAAATDAAHVGRASFRGKAMISLCRGHCLVPYFQLPLIEAVALLKGDDAMPPRDRQTLHGRNDNGRWFPSFQDVFDEAAQETSALASNPYGALGLEPSNRAERRRVESGKAAKAMQRTIQQNAVLMTARFASRLGEHFPISRNTESKVRRMVLHPGTSSAAAAEAAIAADLADVPTVMPWLAKESSSLSGIPAWIRSPAAKWVDLVKSARQALDAAGPQAEDAEAKADGRRRLNTKIFRATLDKLKEDPDIERDLKLHGVKRADLIATTESAGLDALPSRKVMADLLWANMQRSFAPSRTARNPEKASSDPGDMAHAWYIPYVDVMRVDADAEQYMRLCGREYATQLVTRIEELPGVLRRRLQNQ